LSGHADEPSLRLGVFVVRIAAGRHEIHARLDFVARVQAGEERTQAVELIIKVGRVGLHTVVGRTAKDGVRNAGCAPRVLDVIPDRVPSA